MRVVQTFAPALLAVMAHVYAVQGLLPTPQNITIQAVNTQYIMKWDWDEHQTNRTANFTAEYLPAFKKQRRGKIKWTQVCMEITETECDFSPELSYYGIYYLRLRANSNGEHSPWTEIEFCPDKNADLGPPSKVEVTSVRGMLEVKLTDPMTTDNTSMRDKVRDLTYLIEYQKDESQSKVSPIHKIKTQNNMIIISGLEYWTVYCVRVQALESDLNKRSKFSPVMCRQTEDDGHAPPWLIGLVFLLAMVVSCGIILLCFFSFYKSYRTVRKAFFPSYELPANIRECLEDSSLSSDTPQLLTVESELELCCQMLDVVPEENTNVSLRSLSLTEVDVVKHSRQDSGDSGVYSAAEGSGVPLDTKLKWSLQEEDTGKGEDTDLLEKNKLSTHTNCTIKV
ncbi:interferon alpha/beta receptor 1a-like [Lepisosteus oculatus]|uniref:interferon alpha/beta receptor 1a-like n=1 Tax=Lepisosteus oculatus TaxID=7918 RepID=UPI0007404959|nr:PREDICTED: interferon alpha/beta receptor 1a-like [Lepisosteus oculatus]